MIPFAQLWSMVRQKEIHTKNKPLSERLIIAGDFRIQEHGLIFTRILIVRFGLVHFLVLVHLLIFSEDTVTFEAIFFHGNLRNFNLFWLTVWIVLYSSKIKSEGSINILRSRDPLRRRFCSHVAFCPRLPIASLSTARSQSTTWLVAWHSGKKLPIWSSKITQSITQNGPLTQTRATAVQKVNSSVKFTEK